MALEYRLEFGGIPFVSDVARVVRMPQQKPEQESDVDAQPPRKYQPKEDFLDEINRLIPMEYLQDFVPNPEFAGRNLSALSQPQKSSPFPEPSVRVGDWYYPSCASRWSVFRGLATSSQAKAMLELINTSSLSYPIFTMKSVPTVPTSAAEADYTVQTRMTMLPPRPLAELGGSFDGLYLITLVDERYYWQYSSITLHPNSKTTWTDLLLLLQTNLGISLTCSALAPAYGTGPEPDSQIWTNVESTALLLDAVAYNLGRMVVRNLDGTYALMTPVESYVVSSANRSLSEEARIAGGDIFNTDTRYPAGDLSAAQNLVIPASVVVSFPKYVTGNDPVPHYLNSRYANQRPTSWFEDSCGSTYEVTVPITSGGINVVGLDGVGVESHSLRTTAKALMLAEQLPVPTNLSGMTSLAMQLANDYYNNQVLASLDVVLPGTFKWTPEGLHDIIWTYSDRSRLAACRVLRTEWNKIIRDFQHTSGPVPGAGGHSVAQTIRERFNFQSQTEYSPIQTTLDTPLFSGVMTANFASISNFPTDQRWLGLIESERVLFEGTSGNLSVGVVCRGYDATDEVNHLLGAPVVQQPNTTYGVNLTTYERGQFAFPADYTSGGIQGVNVVPQLQTVKVLDDTPVDFNGQNYFPGVLQEYDTVIPGWRDRADIWITARDNSDLATDDMLGGQFVGYSKEPAAPVYVVDVNAGSSSTFTDITVNNSATFNGLFVQFNVLNVVFGATTFVTFLNGVSFVGLVRFTKDIAAPNTKKYARVYTTSLGIPYVRSNNIISSANVLPSQDGVMLEVGDILLYHLAQNPSVDNGLWEVVDNGSVSGNTLLDRSADANTSELLPRGCQIKVWDGMTQRNTVWELMTSPPVLSTDDIILNTTPLDFHKESIDIDLDLISNDVVRYIDQSASPDQMQKFTRTTATDDRITFTLNKRHATPTSQITLNFGNVGDINVSDLTYVELFSLGQATVAGITNGTNGRRLRLVNISLQSVTLLRNAGVVATNGILYRPEAITGFIPSIVLNQYEHIDLIYSPFALRWIVVNPDANSSTRGFVSTQTQAFNGSKTFIQPITVYGGASPGTYGSNFITFVRAGVFSPLTTVGFYAPLDTTTWPNSGTDNTFWALLITGGNPVTQSLTLAAYAQGGIPCLLLGDPSNATQAAYAVKKQGMAGPFKIGVTGALPGNGEAVGGIVTTIPVTPAASATGSFVAGAKTITVVNGVITSIV